jgi:hypothetical protein
VTTDAPGLLEIAARYDTDKATNAHYLRTYENLFGGLRDREIALLELGVHTGGSLLLWRDYFSSGRIVGLDRKPVRVADETNRIRTYQGAQQDASLLDRIGRESAPDGFDIIIDDCSHIGVLARASFWHLFENHLKSGGIYAIEDWGTAYWNWWVDGLAYSPPRAGYSHAMHRIALKLQNVRTSAVVQRFPALWRPFARLKALLLKRQYRSHDVGMAGFIKELVDESASGDITHERLGEGPYRPSRFREMRISHGLVIVIKA